MSGAISIPRPIAAGTNGHSYASERTLVLNVTFEPIGVVSGRRAVVLALGEKVDVLAESATIIHSAQTHIALPSVLRLRYYVSVPYQRSTPVTRRSVFVRDNSQCQYCGDSAESIDHVVPRSRGGRHIWTNVVACCRRCNTSKANLLLHETNLRLRSTPRPPAKLAWIRVAAGRVPAAWDQYLNLQAA